LLAGAARRGGPVAVVYHADADGISAAALACTAIERLGGTVVTLTPPKGKNVYDETFRARLESSGAKAALVLDTGGRGGSSWRRLPTVIVDHHAADGAPDVDVFVHDEHATSTSLLVLDLLRPLAPIEDRAWLAAVGALGDRGDAARSEAPVRAATARFGGASVPEVVSLVNASGRAGDPAPEIALEALRAADDPRTIARGEGATAARLHAMRVEVAEASRRARRVAPRIRGRWAIIEIHEKCRVHGIIASAWARRLAPSIVLVANKGYVEGRVHLSVRSHERTDLRAAMRALLPDEGGDYAAGHERATGAIIDVPTYERMLRAIDDEAARLGGVEHGRARSRATSSARGSSARARRRRRMEIAPPSWGERRTTHEVESWRERASEDAPEARDTEEARQQARARGGGARSAAAARASRERRRVDRRAERRQPAGDRAGRNRAPRRS